MAYLKPLEIMNHEYGKNSSKKNSQGFFVLIKNLKYILIFLAIIFVSLLLWSNPTSNLVIKKVIGQGSNLELDGDRVNILLLGMAGGNHEGATLTDTIIVASMDTKTSEVNLISLPRDLWVDSENSKINALYQKGLNDEGGLLFAEGKIGEVLGIKIPYGIRMDFSGFTKAVDLIGGIEVDVEKEFDDYLYPVAGKEKDYCNQEEKEIEIDEEKAKELNVEPGKHMVLIDSLGKIATASASVGGKIEYTEDNVGKYFPCRYEHISFSQGKTVMDGETALKFVRSRHGTNGEGSDFARSRRQQQVLAAFKSKVLSMETLADINKLTGLLKTFGESVESDIPQTAYPELVNLVRKISGVKSTVLSSEGSNALLVVPSPGTYPAWVLIPKNNDFTQIQNYLKDVFNNTDAATKSAKPQDR